MAKKQTIGLDVAFDSDETIEQVLEKMTAGRKVTAKIVELHGPGGGWPYVEFTGKPKALESMLDAHYTGWREDLPDILAA